MCDTTINPAYADYAILNDEGYVCGVSDDAPEEARQAYRIDLATVIGINRLISGQSGRDMTLSIRKYEMLKSLGVYDALSNDPLYKKCAEELIRSEDPLEFIV